MATTRVISSFRLRIGFIGGTFEAEFEDLYSADGLVSAQYALKPKRHHCPSGVAVISFATQR
jgi:hypothetical protein